MIYLLIAFFNINIGASRGTLGRSGTDPKEVEFSWKVLGYCVLGGAVAGLIPTKEQWRRKNTDS
ncbi:hypothetical protein [Corynebacterium lowii]|uniref:hypothetical protein n=1 Tax=Corynebacterium lowii TaxID=1544413 RepID=UPI000A6432E1|nr:hypothetical protein [Corynebacterium lowii]MDP9852796.1 hypothetical protein [Corynebacterium lowii]